MRRRGLGTYLVKEALYNIYHRGCRQVFLEVDSEDTGTQAFYREIGFTRVEGLFPRIRGMLGSRDTVLLSFDLSSDISWLNRPDSGFKYMGIT
jgi:ribosomal protein S18 acetylase RimI-like enzyme